jgi:energy-converting hydrogenase Eha subunit A
MLGHVLAFDVVVVVVVVVISVVIVIVVVVASLLALLRLRSRPKRHKWRANLNAAQTKSVIFS